MVSEDIDDLIHEAMLATSGQSAAAQQLLLSALVAHIDRASSSTLDRQRRLRAAAQALLEEIHDREITQV